MVRDIQGGKIYKWFISENQMKKLQNRQYAYDELRTSGIGDQKCKISSCICSLSVLMPDLQPLGIPKKGTAFPELYSPFEPPYDPREVYEAMIKNTDQMMLLSLSKGRLGYEREC